MLTQNLQSQSNYAITPSQLDAFISMMDAPIDYDKYWGHSDNPSKTLEEYQAECEKKLIDQINRCDGEPIEAADLGTAFNEIVDMLIHNKNTPSIKGLQVESYFDTTYGRKLINARINGFAFCFDAGLCIDVSRMFPDAICQFRCEGDLVTKYGNVLLYGYLDEWCADKVYDIKTTTNYQFGKFETKSQKHIYPYCIMWSGLSTDIREFEYTVVKWNKPTKAIPFYTGEIYKEVYSFNYKSSEHWLRERVESFIDWLNFRREYITDKRIFGGENPAGYVGTPIDINLLMV